MVIIIITLLFVNYFKAAMRMQADYAYIVVSSLTLLTFFCNLNRNIFYPNILK